MAIEAGAPIVPVSIAGTQRLWPKGSWTITPGEATVAFGPAVDASEYTLESRAELIQRLSRLWLPRCRRNSSRFRNPSVVASAKRKLLLHLNCA